MNIKGCREKKGISQIQLSEMLGVTGQTVWRWENGQRQPDLSTLVHIGKILGCSLDDLVAEALPNPPCPQAMKLRGAGAAIATTG